MVYPDDVFPVVPTIPAAVTWRLVNVYLLEKSGDTCEHCGHPIKYVYTIKSSTGAAMKVGSECVNQFVLPDQRANTESIARRFTRAASQWRNQTPAPRTDETRTDYINRRVREMGNALNAANVWTSWHKKNPRYIQSEVDRLVKERGIKHPLEGGITVAEYSAAVGQIRNEIGNRITSAIESQCHANRYDFCRPMWEVRKI